MRISCSESGSPVEPLPEVSWPALLGEYTRVYIVRFAMGAGGLDKSNDHEVLGESGPRAELMRGACHETKAATANKWQAAARASQTGREVPASREP